MDPHLRSHKKRKTNGAAGDVMPLPWRSLVATCYFFVVFSLFLFHCDERKRDARVCCTGEREGKMAASVILQHPVFIQHHPTPVSPEDPQKERPGLSIRPTDDVSHHETDQSGPSLWAESALPLKIPRRRRTWSSAASWLMAAQFLFLRGGWTASCHWPARNNKSDREILSVGRMLAALSFSSRSADDKNDLLLLLRRRLFTDGA